MSKDNIVKVKKPLRGTAVDKIFQESSMATQSIAENSQPIKNQENLVSIEKCLKSPEAYELYRKFIFMRSHKDGISSKEISNEKLAYVSKNFYTKQVEKLLKEISQQSLQSYNSHLSAYLKLASKNKNSLQYHATQHPSELNIKKYLNLLSNIDNATIQLYTAEFAEQLIKHSNQTIANKSTTVSPLVSLK